MELNGTFVVRTTVTVKKIEGDQVTLHVIASKDGQVTVDHILTMRVGEDITTEASVQMSMGVN